MLDFVNDADTIQNAFADYYRTTVLAEETDPNRLHDLKAELDGFQVYDLAQIDDLVERYLAGADRDRLDPILDACVAVYWEHLDEDVSLRRWLQKHQPEASIERDKGTGSTRHVQVSELTR